MLLSFSGRPDCSGPRTVTARKVVAGRSVIRERRLKCACNRRHARRVCGRKSEGYPARTGETSTTGGVDPVVTTGVVLVLVVVAVAVGDEVAVADAVVVDETGVVVLVAVVVEVAELVLVAVTTSG